MDWLSAADALAILGTQPQTLYANVSRGRIRSRPDPDDSRKSLYAEEDVRRLASRRRGRRAKEEVAAEAIRWGEPVLPSAISTIVDGRLYYRGQDAMALAETMTMEQVAALLWDADVQSSPERSGGEKGGEPLSRLMASLAGMAATDLPTSGRAKTVLTGDALRVLGTVTASLAGEGNTPAHIRLAESWGRPELAELIRKALVLLADHELNASTFAARVAASTGASLSASVLAGLAALTGPRHGSASVQALGLLRSARAIGAQNAVRACLAEGRDLPGFGHTLYPKGDIRATVLFENFTLPDLDIELIEVARELAGEQPNVDLALAALTLAYDLPDTAGFVLFALARSAGWLAHAMEQAASSHLIRPRARYTGVPVVNGSG